MILIEAQFEDFFEAPFGAIPFYLIVGMCLAPLLQETKNKVATVAPGL
jgi:hypothetical protein